MDKTDIAKRMKAYEAVSKSSLTRRLPVIIRIDGKAHHSFTRGFEKPFDTLYMTCMQETMLHLCANIQGCVLGYMQSDEISLLLIDYKKLTSSAWFDNEICSVAASMATMRFNQLWCKTVEDYLNYSIVNDIDTPDEIKYCNTLQASIGKGAMFDARCFTLPKEEVTNYFFWRQYDATKNAIQMVGRAYFSHKQLDNKSCVQIREMLSTEKGVDFNEFPIEQQRGSCCIKREVPLDSGQTLREWIIDRNIPVFKDKGRAYIDRSVFIDG